MNLTNNKILAPLFALTLVQGNFVNAQSETDKSSRSLIGEWKSNTELTTQSLNSIEGISEQSREYLKKNVFGRLRVEFTETEMRSYFGKNSQTSNQFAPYKIISQTDSEIRIEHTDPLTEKNKQSTLYWELDCYYELVSKWQYKEYFCPATNNKKKFIAAPANL